MNACSQIPIAEKNRQVTMRIALIDTSGYATGYGSRLLSAVLKQQGHQVFMIFLPVKLDDSENQLQPLHEVLCSVAIVMISVYSHGVFMAAQITRFVRRKYPGMKIFWGGPHCIGAPRWGLDYADGVCFAEGDEAVVELTNAIESGRDYSNVKSMAFNINGVQQINEPNLPFYDLNSLPYPDYELEGQYVFDGKLRRLSKDNLQVYSGHYSFGLPTYWTLTERGCPNMCAYCGNTCYAALYGRNPVRFRNVKDVVWEVNQLLDKMDIFDAVAFGDDDFLLRPLDDIEEFAHLYKKMIGIPFFILASARGINGEKLEALLDAGMKIIQLGVQSGSQRVVEDVFNRNISVKTTRAAVRKIRPYLKSHDLQMNLDFIIDNPYETKEDILQTYRYISKLPTGRLRLNLFRLTFFPGTPLYKRALSDGYITSFDEKTFRIFHKKTIDFQKNYATFLLFLIRFFHRRGFLRVIPDIFLMLIASRPIVGITSFFPEKCWEPLIKIIQKY